MFCAVSSLVRKVEVMAENKPKWYEILKLLVFTILSIADPITDILTLVEFYRADHKTWFGVGLTFIILPSLYFSVFNCFVHAIMTMEYDDKGQWKAWEYIQALVLGCNPLFPAWMKLQTLYCCLKKKLPKRWQRNINNDQTDEDLGTLRPYSKLADLSEAALESAPQFIMQMYAMAVQQDSVAIVQMVSLPLSFFSIVWASTVADELLHTELAHGNLKLRVKDKVLLFITHIFILSSRLFAIALFTVSYKWWVVSILIFHSTVITISDRGWPCKGKSFDCNLRQIQSVMFFCGHWLRDDLASTQEKNKNLRTMQLVSSVLFVIENITMILLFYFSHFPHTWYSLPVTTCVCLFAVLGAVMRLTHFYFLTKESDDQSNNTDRVQQQSHSCSNIK